MVKKVIGGILGSIGNGVITVMSLIIIIYTPIILVFSDPVLVSSLGFQIFYWILVALTIFAVVVAVFSLYSGITKKGAILPFVLLLSSAIGHVAYYILFLIIIATDSVLLFLYMLLLGWIIIVGIVLSIIGSILFIAARSEFGRIKGGSGKKTITKF
jgi:hypothetical protein